MRVKPRTLKPRDIIDGCEVVCARTLESDRNTYEILLDDGRVLNVRSNETVEVTWSPKR